ncbi:hypothetical protein J2Z75_005058 [Rhizobium herbae]|uniref:Uncharacterized protein n=2 Tax=Rhizobium herbae TaxID=508661 RepID=A0ABS4EU93_9HYPH|nr:hypothetical protein [Rhizobium herbae]
MAPLKTQRWMMPSGDHPGEHFASMTQYGRAPLSEGALVGGHPYLDVTRYFVTLFCDGGYLTANASITAMNGPNLGGQEGGREADLNPAYTEMLYMLDFRS